MKNQSLLYVPFGAFFEREEYSEALKTGWFPYSNKFWFQSRSTRINISKYKPSKKILKLSNKIKAFPSLNFSEDRKTFLKSIYNKYLTYKDFDDRSLTINDMIKNSDGALYYFYNAKIIGFSFYKIINDAYLSIEFAWDYEQPKLSLGHVSIYHEIMYAKMKRCKYFYMSSGYETCSLYKADYPGFEWWTGSNWSKDVDQYKKLCYADESIKVENFDFC